MAKKKEVAEVLNFGSKADLEQFKLAVMKASQVTLICNDSIGFDPEQFTATIHPTRAHFLIQVGVEYGKLKVI